MLRLRTVGKLLRLLPQQKARALALELLFYSRLDLLKRGRSRRFHRQQLEHCEALRRRSYLRRRFFRRTEHGIHELRRWTQSRHHIAAAEKIRGRNRHALRRR